MLRAKDFVKYRTLEIMLRTHELLPLNVSYHRQSQLRSITLVSVELVKVIVFIFISRL